MCGAISNAIYQAVGVRLHEAPFTPERVWRALQDKNSLSGSSTKSVARPSGANRAGHSEHSEESVAKPESTDP